jgi:hypothetical protein
LIRTGRSGCAAVAAVLLAWASVGRAQSDAFSEELIPTEPGVEDVSPIAENLRYVDPRAAESPRFDRLWRLRGTNYFVRIEGAVHAVFRQSDYQHTAGGVQTLVPADTVFYLDPPTHLLPAHQRERREMAGASEATGSRVATRRLVRPAATSASADGPAWVSRRVDRYVRDAAEAERWRTAPAGAGSERLAGAGSERSAGAGQVRARPMVTAPPPAPRAGSEAAVDDGARALASERERVRRVGELLRLAREEPTRPDA